jgi:hypothetical protein
MIIKKICPKCNKGFDEDVIRGYGRTYCSRTCANSRSRDPETRRKIAYTAKNTWNAKSEDGKIKAIEALQRGHISRTKNSLQRLLTESTEALGHHARKKKVFLEQHEKCNKCGIQDWNGEPLSFELEHKDGDKHNNVRDNLEVLCPNCHAQTSTWRGRNNKRV